MTPTLAAMAAIGLDELLQYIVLFFIFVLPGIKASRDAKKKKDEHARRSRPAAPAPDARAEPRSGQPGGKELWERLLRGEIEPAAPPLPPPVPKASKPKRRPGPKPAESKPRPQPIVREPLAAPMGGTQELPKLASQRPALSKAVSENALEAGADELESLVSPFDSPIGEAPLEVDSEAGELQPELITIEATGSRDDWRRAIVLSEVLGTPVALRTGAGPDALPGLS